MLGVGADGTLDIGSGLVIESLRVVDGGTLEVPSFQDYTQATVGDLSLSGQIAISISDNAQVVAAGGGAGVDPVEGEGAALHRTHQLVLTMPRSVAIRIASSRLEAPSRR